MGKEVVSAFDDMQKLSSKWHTSLGTLFGKTQSPRRTAPRAV